MCSFFDRYYGESPWHASLASGASHKWSMDSVKVLNSVPGTTLVAQGVLMVGSSSVNFYRGHYEEIVKLPLVGGRSTKWFVCCYISSTQRMLRCVEGFVSKEEGGFPFALATLQQITVRGGDDELNKRVFSFGSGSGSTLEDLGSVGGPLELVYDLTSPSRGSVQVRLVSASAPRGLSDQKSLGPATARFQQPAAGRSSNTLLFCSNCGSKKDDPKAKFCTSCGAVQAPPGSASVAMLRGDAAIHHAARHGDMDTLEECLDLLGVDINLPTSSSGASPLILAAGAQQRLVVEKLLSKGANVNFANRSGATALHGAVVKAGPEAGLIVDALLAAGADVHATTKLGAAVEDNATALEMASQLEENAMEIIQKLLAAGGRLRSGKLLPRIEIEGGGGEVVQLNADQTTYMMVEAASRSDFELVMFLVATCEQQQLRPQLDIVLTVTLIASWASTGGPFATKERARSTLAVADCLLAAGANPDTRDPLGGTILSHLLASDSHEAGQLAERCIVEGASVHTACTCGVKGFGQQWTLDQAVPVWLVASKVGEFSAFPAAQVISLARHRNPLPYGLKPLNSQSGQELRVKVATAKPHPLYKIILTRGENSAAVVSVHRYAKFKEFFDTVHEELLREKVELPDFPRRTLKSKLGLSLSDAELADRAQKLEVWLQKVLEVADGSLCPQAQGDLKQLLGGCLPSGAPPGVQGRALAEEEGTTKPGDGGAHLAYCGLNPDPTTLSGAFLGAFSISEGSFVFRMSAMSDSGSDQGAAAE